MIQYIVERLVGTNVTLQAEVAKGMVSVAVAFLGIIGVVITAIVALRQRVTDAKYSFSGKLLDHALRQQTEFYAPLRALNRESDLLYEQLRSLVKVRFPEFGNQSFRLVDKMDTALQDSDIATIIERIVDIGRAMRKIVNDKAGLVEGQDLDIYAQYLAHLSILELRFAKGLTFAGLEKLCEFAYYPRLLNRHLLEGFKSVNGRITRYQNAASAIADKLLSSKPQATENSRIWLLQNLSYYESHAQNYPAVASRVDYSIIYSRVFGHINKKEPLAILDAGAGTGQHTLYFLKNRHVVTALEPSPAMLSQCRQAAEDNKLSGNLHFFEAPFDELTGREKYDLVWASASLLHIPEGELQATLATLCRTLKRDGTIFFSLRVGRGNKEFDGRYFSYMTHRLAKRLVAKQKNIELVDYFYTDSSAQIASSTLFEKIVWWIVPHAPADRGLWINVVAKKIA